MPFDEQVSKKAPTDGYSDPMHAKQATTSPSSLHHVPICETRCAGVHFAAARRVIAVCVCAAILAVVAQSTLAPLPRPHPSPLHC